MSSRLLDFALFVTRGIRIEFILTRTNFPVDGGARGALLYCRKVDTRWTPGDAAPTEWGDEKPWAGRCGKRLRSKFAASPEMLLTAILNIDQIPIDANQPVFRHAIQIVSHPPVRRTAHEIG